MSLNGLNGQSRGNFDRGWLNLAGEDIDDTYMNVVWITPGVTRLLLGDNPRLTDAWLNKCRRPTEIVYLELTNNKQMTDDALLLLPRYFPKLVVLNLTGTSTTLQGIVAHLPQCPLLCDVCHGGFAVTPENEKIAYQHFHEMVAHGVFAERN
jgi:hypothetical protein